MRKLLLILYVLTFWSCEDENEKDEGFSLKKDQYLKNKRR